MNPQARGGLFCLGLLSLRQLILLPCHASKNLSFPTIAPPMGGSLLFGFVSAAQPVTLAGDLNNFGAGQQAIQDRRGCGNVVH